MIIEIDDATSYWLEDPEGHHVSPESLSSAHPLAVVLAALDAGRSPDVLVLMCRLADGQRHEIGGGDALVDAAPGAAGRSAVRLPRLRGTDSA